MNIFEMKKAFSSVTNAAKASTPETKPVEDTVSAATVEDTASATSVEDIVFKKPLIEDTVSATSVEDTVKKPVSDMGYTAHQLVLEDEYLEMVDASGDGYEPTKHLQSKIDVGDAAENWIKVMSIANHTDIAKHNMTQRCRNHLRKHGRTVVDCTMEKIATWYSDMSMPLLSLALGDKPTLEKCGLPPEMDVHAMARVFEAFQDFEESLRIMSKVGNAKELKAFWAMIAVNILMEDVEAPAGIIDSEAVKAKKSDVDTKKAKVSKKRKAKASKKRGDIVVTGRFFDTGHRPSYGSGNSGTEYGITIKLPIRGADDNFKAVQEFMKRHHPFGIIEDDVIVASKVTALRITVVDWHNTWDKKVENGCSYVDICAVGGVDSYKYLQEENGLLKVSISKPKVQVK